MPSIAALYVVFAATAVQVLPAIFDAFGFPAAASRVVILAAVAGVPVTLVLAWFYDFSATGIRRERPMPAGGPAIAAKRLARAMLVLVTILVAGVGAGLLWRVRSGPPPSGEPTDAASLAPDRVAVLYFREEPRGGQSRELATNLTVTLIEELGRTRGLSVMPAAAVAPYRDRATPTDSIARALHVGTIVDGTVTVAQGVVRVQVEAMDAGTGDPLGSRSIERPSEELFSLVSGVVREAGALLRERIGAAVQLNEWHAGTKSEEAWALLQRGNRAIGAAQDLVDRGEFADATRTLQRADSLLELAERADASWNRPPVLRGSVAYRLWFLASGPWGGNAKVAEAALERGIEQTTLALARKPDDAEALEIRGLLRYWRASALRGPARGAADTLFAAARDDLHEAVTQDPHRPRAWSLLGALSFATQDYASTMRYAHFAFDEDRYALVPEREPTGNYWRGFRSAFELAEDSTARIWCDELRARSPDDALAALCSLQLMAWSDGSPDVRLAVARREAAGRGDPAQIQAAMRPSLDFALAAVLARAGMRDSAEAVVARARNPRMPLLLEYEAQVRERMGQSAQAMRLLDAYLRAAPDNARRIEKARAYATLRNRPDFARLVGRASLNR